MTNLITTTVLQPLAVGPEVAASLTGTTRSTIYHAIAIGELNAFKSGRRRLILMRELEAWITTVAARSRL
ncbi:helix-turn-helix domain-containing protein [Pseudomonas coleopterorum]|uniref:Helix-turn-helix domain-containing protein n=1 Tax=Pseudomonas coleopterorum TaxID=1605838 RepID=A0AAJ6MSR7_9PSED|nr:helix-turn-helix domain-containing protein [Pseudomonas coleopterorum]WNC09311.1 helix-turn-helix domain-containing protein [Pseudomonas coleopterorum]